MRRRIMALRGNVLRAALDRFLATGLDDVLSGSAPGEAEQRALALFTSVVATVPAYRTFLAEHDVDPAAVPAGEAVPGRRAGELRHGRGVLRIDRRAHLLATVGSRRVRGGHPLRAGLPRQFRR